MSEYNMNGHMKLKYRSMRPIQGFPAKPRTGNSHGPAKSKLPAHQPCKRAPAGAKTFSAQVGNELLDATSQKNHRQRVLVLYAGTGKRRMEDLPT